MNWLWIGMPLLLVLLLGVVHLAIKIYDKGKEEIEGK